MSRVSVWEIDNPGLGKQPLWLRAPPNKRPSLMTLDFLDLLIWWLEKTQAYSPNGGEKC